MSVSEVLNKAADHIERRGWRTGGWGGGAGSSAPLCIEGAIAAAMGYDFTSLENDLPSAETNHNFCEMLVCPAVVAVKAFLDMDPDLELWRFNDTFGRTKSEVIEVLRAAAVIEESREAAAIIAAACELDVRVVGASS